MGPRQAQAQTAGGAEAIRPFHVHFPDEALADLKRRIAATRWPEREIVTDQSQGVQLATVQKLARYWETAYDWRKCEAKLNALPQFYAIEGVLPYQLDGQPPVTLKAGEVLFIPAGAIHAVRNVGGGNAAELATHFVEKGKPLVVPRRRRPNTAAQALIRRRGDVGDPS